MSDVRVQDVMTHLVVTLYPKDTVHEAAQRLARNRITGAPVVVAGKVIGIVSEADLIHAVMPPVPVHRGLSVLDVLSVMGKARPRDQEHSKTVADVMSAPVIQVSPETSVWKAASIMERKGVKRLPVVDDDGYLLGLVSRADLVRTMARDDEQIRAEVTGAIKILGEETIDGLGVDVADGVASIKGVADRRTTHELAVKLASRVPGVVEVVDRMTFERDDTKIKVASNPDPDPRLNWRPQSAVNEGPR